MCCGARAALGVRNERLALCCAPIWQTNYRRTPAVDVGVMVEHPHPQLVHGDVRRHREVPRTSREQPSKAQGKEAIDAHTSRGAVASTGAGIALKTAAGGDGGSGGSLARPGSSLQAK